ncbi:hypothetical protein B0J17DRAFT_633586 [Rhizoctonia solani]|nr:hypothetical protein B0J17DRAFT_633586 [Rhizoctonia solani]
MSTSDSFGPLPEWFLKRLENIEALPKLTFDDICGEINIIFLHFFAGRDPHCWMAKPHGAIYQAATPETERRFTDEYHREVDGNIRFDTPEFNVCKHTGTMDYDIARLVVSVVGTESGNEEKGLERLEKWTKKLYEGLDDAHGAKVLQGLMVTGVFVQVFDLAEEGGGMKLVPALEKMSFRSSGFHNYLHKAARET